MEMDGHDNILVLKLSEGKDLPVERIGQLANGRWKINAIKIQTVKKVIVMIQQEVIADFSLGDTLTIELKNQGRITNLGLVDSKMQLDQLDISQTIEQLIQQLLKL